LLSSPANCQLSYSLNRFSSAFCWDFQVRCFSFPRLHSIFRSIGKGWKLYSNIIQLFCFRITEDCVWVLRFRCRQVWTSFEVCPFVRLKGAGFTESFAPRRWDWYFPRGAFGCAACKSPTLGSLSRVCFWVRWLRRPASKVELLRVWVPTDAIGLPLRGLELRLSASRLKRSASRIPHSESWLCFPLRRWAVCFGFRTTVVSSWALRFDWPYSYTQLSVCRSVL
jgi:hypothetical protein